MSDDDDAPHLIARLADGCPDASHELVRRYGPGLAAWFGRAGLQAASAEDCVQDTFVRLLSAAPAYEPRAPFGAFLRRLARNALVDWRRRKATRPSAMADVHGAQVADGVAAPLRCEAELLDLRAAVDALPEKLRAVVALSIGQGLSYAEIGARLGIPEGTVKSRMFHAVRQLRDSLAGAGPRARRSRGGRR